MNIVLVVNSNFITDHITPLFGCCCYCAAMCVCLCLCILFVRLPIYTLCSQSYIPIHPGLLYIHLRDVTTNKLLKRQFFHTTELTYTG